ncbi:uncharacterized protein N7484_005432 [Penicillium longicatenatum]|uniref:uncharacterized protein n=1 Tax=Penicillium longicatenatum TaxID=1561947 RepID=UPI0025473794|nr:uncharacterized protein N7484_005432 [Penicillium longicatenatum]KAJ5642925.1 hypothetical protein N7484_005432 [Penicillium longicatenatum]
MATNLSRMYILSAATSSTPFLYQTRTLSQLSRSLRPPQKLHRHYSTERNGIDLEGESHESSAAQDEQQQNDFTKSTPTDPPPRHISYLRHRGASIPRPEPKRNKKQTPNKKSRTITRNEREAFGGLLSRLNNAQPDQSPLGTQEPAPVPKTDDLMAIMSVFESILEDTRAGAKESQTVKKSQDGVSADKQEQALPRQNNQVEEKNDGADQIHLRDLGFEELFESADADAVVTMAEAVNMVVEREAKRIEKELFQAVEQGKGDSGLWAVCRQRIFTMISHIGGPVSTPAQDPDSSSSSNVLQAPGASPSSGPLNIPAAVPAGPVVAKLYPQLLLLAFRILSTHFPESQLISQFRTAAKAHGRSSAFLGTSEVLCDELMAFYWYSCNDLPAVVSFLRDMDNAGLDPSRRIRKLLRDIVRQYDQDVKSRRKAKGESFWDAPPNKKAFQELVGSGGWIETLQSRKRQRRSTAIPVPKM